MGHPENAIAAIGDVNEIVGHKLARRREIFHERFLDRLEAAESGGGDRPAGRERNEESASGAEERVAGVHVKARRHGSGSVAQARETSTRSIHGVSRKRSPVFVGISSNAPAMRTGAALSRVSVTSDVPTDS